MAQKVYTKKGDKGYTSIIGGSRVKKSDDVINAIGTVDELNAYVGIIRSYQDSDVLGSIQNTLFDIGSHLAGFVGDNSYDVSILEKEMDTMSKQLEPLKNFILPTGNQVVCHCHIARTVTRRTERTLVGLDCNNDLVKYINRLSDYFFVLARYLSKQYDIKETIWTKQ